MTQLTISQQEFDLFRGYVEKHCSISLGDDKKYLLESRLTKLVVENACSNFSEFYRKVSTSTDSGLRDKIVDAMTTNETLWFRDGTPWIAFLECILPELAARAKTAPASRFRVWSAAASTGQECYTISMLIDDYCTRNKLCGLSPDMFEILGTDISPSALFIAMAGRYDRISMNRGFTGDWERFKTAYFTKKGPISMINPDIKRRVQFKRFNLQDDFSPLGRFDIVFLRNVAIYFSAEFKRDLFSRVRRAMTPDGVFFLGSTESLTGYSEEFKPGQHGKAVFYRTNGA